MFAFITLLHVVGFGVLFGFVVPATTTGWAVSIRSSPFGVGILAYTFGLRHAFDADHTPVVDNATRKLMADNA